MTIGHVRDNFIRVILTFPGHAGSVPVEFLVDTGFDGELALPEFVLQQLDASFSIDQEIMLADGSRGKRPLYRMDIDWDDDLRPTDVLLLKGTPLLGVNLLAGSLLQAEMTDGRRRGFNRAAVAVFGYAYHAAGGFLDSACPMTL